jgi:hypothetical protein
MSDTSPIALATLETPISEGQTDRKLFESYINVRETIGTFFLGVLTISLFLALQRTSRRYEELLERLHSVRDD